MPTQLPESENDGVCCKTCLTDTCDICSLLKMKEHVVHCTCKQQLRMFSDDFIRQSLSPLLTADNLTHLLYRCSIYNPNPMNRGKKKRRVLSRPQLVLPDYSTVTLSEARDCIASEAEALFSLHCARSDSLVYSNDVPIYANDCRINNKKIQVIIKHQLYFTAKIKLRLSKYVSSTRAFLSRSTVRHSISTIPLRYFRVSVTMVHLR